MAFETLPGGLELVIPTNGTKNWGTVVRNATWVKINNHTHTGGGDGTQLTGASLVDGSIGSEKLNNNFAFTQQASAIVPVANFATVDWNDGNKAELDVSTATGSVGLTLSNPATGASYRLVVTQGATVYSILWPADVKWPGDEEPSQFMEANTKNVVYLDYDGTDYISTWELEIS